MMPSPRILPAGKVPGDLLKRLLGSYRTPDDPQVLVGASYGFDAAAIDTHQSPLIVKSDPITFASMDATSYLVAINANDIACLGGLPRWMTIVALLPTGTTSEATVEDLFACLSSACTRHGVSLIGGHTEITLGIDRPILVGTMIGVAGPHGLLKPGGARAGDDLFLTESAGLEGTALLAHEHGQRLIQMLGFETVTAAQLLLRSPGLSVSAPARAFLATGGVTALHDPTEGGVATAIWEMAEASSLGIEVDESSVPIRDETREICRVYDINPLGLIASGALLAAADPAHRDAILEAGRAINVPVSHIGSFQHLDSGRTLRTRNGVEPLPRFDADEIAKAFS